MIFGRWSFVLRLLGAVVRHVLLLFAALGLAGALLYTLFLAVSAVVPGGH